MRVITLRRRLGWWEPYCFCSCPFNSGLPHWPASQSCSEGWSSSPIQQWSRHTACSPCSRKTLLLPCRIVQYRRRHSWDWDTYRIGCLWWARVPSPPERKSPSLHQARLFWIILGRQSQGSQGRMFWKIFFSTKNIISRINDIVIIQIRRFLDVKILLKASSSPINILIARLRPMLNAIFSK